MAKTKQSETTNYASLHQQLVSEILSAGSVKKTNQRAFIEQMFALVPVGELEELDPAHAHALAVRCETFAATRKGNGPQLQVENFRAVGHPQRQWPTAASGEFPCRGHQPHAHAHSGAE